MAIDPDYYRTKLRFEYAGFWVRFAATIIDISLMMAITLPVLIAIYGVSYVTSPEAPLIAGFYDFLISWVLPAIAIFFFWMKKKATPGKMLFNLTVVDSRTGQPISLNQALLRYFGYFLSGMGFGIGFLWIVFDPKKQAWHDKISHTVVLRLKTQTLESLIFDAF